MNPTSARPESRWATKDTRRANSALATTTMTTEAVQGKRRASLLAKGSWLDALLLAKGYDLTTSKAAKVKKKRSPSKALVPTKTRPPDLAPSSPALTVSVKRADMSEEAVALAVQVATDTIDLFGPESHRDIAKSLKEEFDRELSPAWQCIVGQRFGSFITHAQGTFVYFLVDDLAILLFRTIPASIRE